MSGGRTLAEFLFEARFARDERTGAPLMSRDGVVVVYSEDLRVSTGLTLGLFRADGTVWRRELVDGGCRLADASVFVQRNGQMLAVGRGVAGEAVSLR